MPFSGGVMKYEFSTDRPIYEQIIEFMTVEIAEGAFEYGDKVPSVRDYAVMFGVNPNTMQKALAELERLGLITSKRGDGRYFDGNVETAKKMREAIAKRKTARFVSEMKSIGYSAEQTSDIF